MSRLAPAALALAWLAAWPSGAHADTSGQQLAERAGRPLVGTPAPRLTLDTIDGSRIDLGRLIGRQAVYLKFWATWCTPCREQMPHFEKTYQTAGPDLAVIAVNVGFNDSLDDIRAYRTKLGITMPIVRDDGRVAAAFHLRVTPQHIVIGRDGKILYVGHLADSRLDAALREARSAPPSPSRGVDHATVVDDLPRFGIGDRLPPRTVTTVDGPRLPLRPVAAPRDTVLVFLSPWCESYLETTRPAVAANCRQAREWAASLTAAGRVRCIGVASGLWATPDDVRAFRSRHGLRMPLTLDVSGSLFRAFGINEVPAAVVADSQGRILHIAQGDGLRDLEVARDLPSQAGGAP